MISHLRSISDTVLHVKLCLFVNFRAYTMKWTSLATGHSFSMSSTEMLVFKHKYANYNYVN